MKRLLHLFLFVLSLSSLPAQTGRLVVPLGHAWGFAALAFSPACPDDPGGGRYFASCGADDNCVILWSIDGQEITRFHATTGSDIDQVVFSPDGQSILIGNMNGGATLWRLDGTVIRHFPASPLGVTAVAMSPACGYDRLGGRYTLTADVLGPTRLWDRDGAPVQLLPDSGTIVRLAAFSPDGRFILTASHADTERDEAVVRLWDLRGNELQRLRGHTGWIKSAVFAPDGRHILTCTTDGTVRYWDLDGHELLRLSSNKHGFHSAIFSPDGTRIVTGGGDGALRWWRLDGQEEHVVKAHEHIVSALAFHPDGRHLLSGSFDRRAILWDAHRRKVRTFESHGCLLNGPDLSRDGRYFAAGSRDNTVKLWDLHRSELHVLRGHLSWVMDAAFAPDGRRLVTGSHDRTALIWDLRGRPLHRLSGHQRGILTVEWSANGQLIATGDHNGMAKLWDLHGREVWRFERKNVHGVNSMRIGPDGRHVALQWSEPLTWLWHLDSTTQTLSLPGRNAVFSADSRELLTVDSMVRLYDLAGHQLLTFRVPGYTSTAAFCPDAQSILTGGFDGVARLWDRRGQELRALRGHTAPVVFAAFSANGRLIVTAGNDMTVRLWRADTGEALATLMVLDEDDWVVTAPDGRFDASRGAQKLLYYVDGSAVRPFDRRDDGNFRPGLLTTILDGAK
jgi:WD40 repeat protein